METGWRTSETEVKNIAQQILSILVYLHSQEPPVIHRDIKPNNLIRSDNGGIYLVDFGAVQNTYYNTLMQGSTVVGTYGYMAPEQFRGQALPATDLYSLGATLLYLITHRSPAELPQDTLKLNFRHSVNISESFADWLERMVEPDLDERFASAEIALAQLFAIKKVKQKKLLTRIGVGVLVVGVIAGINSYKWWFLSRIGFYPSGMCNLRISQNYIEQGGKLDIIATEEKFSTLFCMLEENEEKAKIFEKIILSIENISKLINYSNNENKSLLQKAVQYSDYNNYKSIELLIRLDADVNAKSKNNEVILIDAILRYNLYPCAEFSNANHKKIVKLLIKQGADVNAKNSYGLTALFYVSNRDIAQLLIEHGADVNIRNNDGQTPLFRADINIAKLLIEHGADVNVKDNYGSTPLSSAQKDKASLLIEHGANGGVRNLN
ncbi:MAG: ankyrin repeat domain-containing protein [Cyanophyceae cyanobacterium]